MKIICKWCENSFDAFPSSKRKFCSLSCAIKGKRTIMVKGNQMYKGRKHTEEYKRMMSERNKGINRNPPPSLETRLKMSRSHKGEKHYNWQGGKTQKGQQIRKSFEYRLWRESVFKRDNYTCIWCGARGVHLHADHIKEFANYPELRFAIDNGRTLCVPCHKTTDTYLFRGRWKKPI